MLRSVMLIAAFILAFAWLRKDESLLLLQQLKYGTPRTVCVRGTQVVVEPPWVIDLIYGGENTLPKVFGVLPVPVHFTELKDESPQVLLRSATNKGILSIHPGRARRPREDLLASCQASSFCSIGRSTFSNREEVIQIEAGMTTWITYVDRNVMIGLSGIPVEDARGVRITRCTDPEP